MEREEYMRAALTLAHAAAADGEVPVGCVIVDAGGRIIGRGRNRRERTHRADAHAEMEAIAEAWRARGPGGGAGGAPPPVYHPIRGLILKITKTAANFLKLP